MVNLWLYTMSILKIAWHYIALCFPSYMIYITAHYQNILRFSLNPTSLKIAKQENEEITAVYFDIRKCFDKMVLKEAMKELWLKGIQGKHWRLIYKLNSDNILTPITDLGECEPVIVKEMIKQGSVLGSVISALTIDSLTRILEKCESIWEIEGTKIKPLLFQDDIIAINRTKDIQKTVNIIETFQHLKRLEFHEDKTKKSIFNGKRNEKN